MYSKCCIIVINQPCCRQITRIDQEMDKLSEKDFLEQVTSNQNIIHKVCNMFCQDEDDRRDLFQEITIKLWMGHKSYAGQAALTTWMYRVALNTAITLKRKKKRVHETHPLHPNIQISDENEGGVSQQDIDFLYLAIKKLRGSRPGDNTSLPGGKNLRRNCRNYGDYKNSCWR